MLREKYNIKNCVYIIDLSPTVYTKVVKQHKTVSVNWTIIIFKHYIRRMSFLLQRKKGAGIGRVFAFASIANQPHRLENRYVPGSGVGALSISARRALSRRATIIKPPVIQTQSYIYSKDNVTDGGFTIGNEVNQIIDEEDIYGMYNANYTYEFDPDDDYPEFFPDMAPFIQENIVAGDKNEEDILNASYWGDLGNDVFDDWGFFYLYDVNLGKYYFPLINPQNQDDGLFFTQTFNTFGRTFTIKHGWAVQGIFKFDISVADSLPFKFGAYGNMGSDGDEFTESLTQNYSINGQNATLYYHHHAEDDNENEQLYSYWIPKKLSDNNEQTYNVYYDSDDMSIMSKNVTTGLIVYFAKSNDVRDWVINDLGIV